MKRWTELQIDGPRLTPERMREIIERKEFHFSECFLLPGTWLDLLQENEALKEQIERMKNA